ncbi:MAG TPA: hypothetical protein VMW36_08510 [Patescibacteria group bacterium]|nr:hypothetical protein [Patescibacteria group bacterium]
MRKCLLIKTHDNRKLFIRKTSGKGMDEFAKTFKAKISLVELLDPKEKILNNKDFKSAFCDPNHTSDAKYKVVDKLLPKSKRSREDILASANKISRFVKNNLLKGKTVSLQGLKKKYQDEPITSACLCSHFSKVRKELSKEGHSVEKVGSGKYCLR